MDGKGLDFGSMGPTAATMTMSPPSTRLNEPTTTTKKSTNLFDDDDVELKTSELVGGGRLGKDILPIDKDPWAESSSSSSTTAADPNDLFASAPPTAFESPTNIGNAGNAGQIAEAKQGEDDQGWANFDKMNS